MLNHDAARAIALSLPEAEESAHFGKADFRVRKKVFATLPEPGIVVFKLTPPQQAILVEPDDAHFEPVKGGWGEKGWTRLVLEVSDHETLAHAMALAWTNVAPKSLIKASQK